LFGTKNEDGIKFQAIRINLAREMHSVEIDPTLPEWKQKIERFINHPTVQQVIVFLIVLNAVILGLETNRDIVAAFGRELVLVDHAILVVFIVEIVLLMAARGLRFFKDAWCVFDLLVVGIAVIPSTESFSVLRSLRVLRVLRLINKVESMRKVVSGLLNSLPSLASVAGLTLIIFYVFSVMATNLFGHDFPELFGGMGNSAFTLFQVMTLESWSEGVARPVMEKLPYAWIFFLLFILIATFIVINLFIAVIVDSLNSLDNGAEKIVKEEKDIHREVSALREQVAQQNQDLRELKTLLQEQLSRSK
jgi:voltage-gated sodium channel